MGSQNVYSRTGMKIKSQENLKEVIKQPKEECGQAKQIIYLVMRIFTEVSCDQWPF